MTANLIHRFHEHSMRPAEDKIAPWIAQRHGVPNGYVYVNAQPWHWVFAGTVAEVEAEFTEAYGYPMKLAPMAERNMYELRNAEVLR